MEGRTIEECFCWLVATERAMEAAVKDYPESVSEDTRYSYSIIKELRQYIEHGLRYSLRGE